MLHLALRAAANAAASCGLRSRASAPFSRFGLCVFADDGEALRGRKALNGCPLGFYAEAKALLSLGRDSKICDSGFH
jgi:hypothetical protein